MPNPANAYKAAKAAKAVAKAKMATKRVIRHAARGNFVDGGHDPYNSVDNVVTGFRAGRAFMGMTDQPVAKMRASRRMDAVYNIGRSRGMDPRNTLDTYAKAGKMVGTNAARPKPGVKKKTTY